MQKKLNGRATPEQITEMKDKNPGAFAIEGKEDIAYFRVPNMDDLNIAASQVDSDTPFEFNKILMEECFIGGSREMIDNESKFRGASRQFNKKTEGEKAKLVEL